ncbi:uncharacterized protein [Coffea arabica]|uniref:Uncharacterized protein isoform X2 n=1 Tax=Coffea arabica TaxID=13443 RepID=A0ABM4VHT2_COFAR
MFLPHGREGGNYRKMGRAPCCSKVGLQRGPWSPKEDKLLTDYVQANGEGQWRSLPKKAGLLRCGKSCRLRWMNYLRPGIKRGNVTEAEEDLIIRLQSLLGNRWSLIAARLPGRTDNEIKNHWNTRLLKRLHKGGIQPQKSSTSLLSKKSSKQPTKKKSNNKLPDHFHNTTATSSTEDVLHREDFSGNDNATVNMAQVYRPKPIKICSESAKSNSFGSVASGSTNKSSSNQEEGEEVVDKLEEEAKTSQVSDISWSSFELDDQSYEPRFEISDENQILFYDDDDCDLSLQADPVSDSNLLDKVYDEYLRLL